jgi:hypothetical protein
LFFTLRPRGAAGLVGDGCTTLKFCPEIEMRPVRGFPRVLAATVNVTDCVPEPDAVVTVIHVSEVVAVHWQLGVVVTVVDADPPPGLTLSVVGLSVYWQLVLAACVTVRVRPAIVRVPLRWDELVDAATENETFPFPLPVDPDVTVIHETLLWAPQLQPAAVVIAEDPVPPVPATESVVGVIEYEHAAAA